MIPRLKEAFNTGLNEEIKKELGLENVNQIPTLEKIVLNKGDIVFFSNICPHKSEKNNSNFNRRTLYYTYLSKEFGYQYDNYFKDKEKSKNATSKSLND